MRSASEKQEINIGVFQRSFYTILSVLLLVGCEDSSDQRISFGDEEIEQAKIEARAAVIQKKAQYLGEPKENEESTASTESEEALKVKQEALAKASELSLIFSDGKLMVLEQRKEGEEIDLNKLVEPQEMDLPEMWFFAYQKGSLKDTEARKCDSKSTEFFGSLKDLSELKLPNNAQMEVEVCVGKTVNQLVPSGLASKSLYTSPEQPEIRFVEPSEGTSNATLAIELGENKIDDVRVALMVEEKVGDSFKKVGYVDLSKQNEFFLSDTPILGSLKAPADTKNTDTAASFATLGVHLVAGDRYRFKAVLENSFEKLSSPSQAFEFVYRDTLSEEDLFAADERGYKNLAEPVDNPLAIPSDQEKIVKKLDQLDLNEKEAIVKELESDYLSLRDEIKKASESNKELVVIDGEAIPLADAKQQLALNREKVKLLEESKVVEAQIDAIAEKKAKDPLQESPAKEETSIVNQEQAEAAVQDGSKEGEPIASSEKVISESSEIGKQLSTTDEAKQNDEGKSSKSIKTKDYSGKIAKLKEARSKVNDNFKAKKEKLKDKRKAKKVQLAELNSKIKETQKKIKLNKKQIKSKLSDVNKKIKEQEKEMRSLNKLADKDKNQHRKNVKSFEKKVNKVQKQLDKVLVEKGNIDSKLNDSSAKLSLKKQQKFKDKLEKLSAKELTLNQQLSEANAQLEAAKSTSTEGKYVKRKAKIEERLVKLHERKSNLKLKLAKLDDRKDESLKRLVERKEKIKERFGQLQENIASLKEKRKAKVDKINTKIKDLKEKRKSEKVPAH